MPEQQYVVRVQHVLSATPEEIWEVISDTSRYADWVHGVLEVIEHHGTATEGRTYEERNKTVGPLTGRSVWTVLSKDAPVERIDSGVGLDPLGNLVNVFRLTPVDRGESTEMLYEIRFDLPFGPLGKVVAAVLGMGLRRNFGKSMRNLDRVIQSERLVGS